MALGVYGTTLNDELNRLANGGTYRSMANMDEIAKMESLLREQKGLAAKEKGIL